MLEDNDIRKIRDIVAREIYDGIREQLPKMLKSEGTLVTERSLKYELDKLEDRIVKRLS